MSTSDIQVTLDDRARLLASALTVTTYPAIERQRSPHGLHPHIRSTRRHLHPFAGHAAVQTLQTLLDADVPLEDLFASVLAVHEPAGNGSLPLTAEFVEQLEAFRQAASLDAWWAEEPEWALALSDCAEVLQTMQLRNFLAPYIGESNRPLVFMPNLLYPTDHDILFEHDRALVLIVPPRTAWGESPPWPYGDDPAHLIRAVLLGFGAQLVREYLSDHAPVVAAAATRPLPVSDAFASGYASWEEQFIALFCAAVVAIYLEDTLGAKEASGYLLMERRLRGLDVLPSAVSVFRRFRSEQAVGRYAGLADLLPVFPAQLKLANRIRAL